MLNGFTSANTGFIWVNATNDMRVQVYNLLFVGQCYVLARAGSFYLLQKNNEHVTDFKSQFGYLQLIAFESKL
jgi:hypothetical protein